MPDILLHAMQEFAEGFFRSWEGKRVWCTQEDVENGTFLFLFHLLHAKESRKYQGIINP